MNFGKDPKFSELLTYLLASSNDSSFNLTRFANNINAVKGTKKTKRNNPIKKVEIQPSSLSGFKIPPIIKTPIIKKRPGTT